MKYKLMENIHSEVIEECCVLISDCGDAAVLNETGSLIVYSIQNGFSEEEIANALFDIYKSPMEIINNDLKVFVKELVRLKLIEEL